jgi:hypothetical protein
MRRTLLAMMSVMVMSATLSLPVVLALGVDPCANEGDHDCPPLGDDCHDCARCSPQPATLVPPLAASLDMIPTSDERPTLVLAARPPEAPREPPSRVPRILA